MNDGAGHKPTEGGPARSAAALLAAATASTALFWMVGRPLSWGVDAQAAFLLATFALFLAVAVGYSWAVDRVWRRANQEASSALAGFKVDFVADISHELRTSLTGIVGFAQLIDPRLLGGENAEAMRAVVSQSVELSRVVDDMVARARIDAGTLDLQIGPVPVRDQVEAAVAFVEIMGADVEVECGEADLAVDPEAFRHLLRNLLVNAHRHGRPPLAVRGRAFGDRYVCQVVDHGAGVSVAAGAEVFDRPAPGSEARPGAAGLGLTVARDLAERMGCGLSYQHLGGETHFILTVPLAVSGAMPGEGHSGSHGSPSRQLEGV
ncbi:MAG: sensor histidine kinase [Actinomycetota bacterium]